MRALVPITLVMFGFGANEFARSRVPGGLADAEPAAIALLVREGAVAGLDRVVPEWREVFDSRPGHRRVRRSRHMHRHRSPRNEMSGPEFRGIADRITLQRSGGSVRRSTRTLRNVRLRGIESRGRDVESAGLVEIRVLVPVNGKVEFRR